MSKCVQISDLVAFWWPAARLSKESKWEIIKILIIYDLILETWMSFAFFSPGATTDAKDYLRNFNLLEAKVNPTRYSYHV